MIRKISAFNFQSHKKSVLNLHHGVNAIIGTSDSGKSALIIRLLVWVLNNRPLGDAFRSIWGGETRAEIETDENLIVRSKDKKDVYKIDDLELKAFNKDVPDEVTQSLNMSDINIARQFDRPYLLDSSSGEIAQHFNQIAHLDKIDSSLSKIQSQIRSLEHSIKADEQYRKELEESLKDFEDLDALDKEVVELELMQQTKEDIAEEINQIASVIGGLKDSKQQIKKLEKTTAISDIIESSLIDFATRAKLYGKINSLSNLIIKSNTVRLNTEKLVLFTRRDNEITEAIDLLSQKKEASKAIEQLHTDIWNLKGITVRISKTKEEVKELEEEFHNNMPDTCPLCGQEVA